MSWTRTAVYLCGLLVALALRQGDAAAIPLDEDHPHFTDDGTDYTRESLSIQPDDGPSSGPKDMIDLPRTLIAPVQLSAVDQPTFHDSGEPKRNKRSHCAQCGGGYGGYGGYGGGGYGGGGYGGGYPSKVIVAKVYPRGGGGWGGGRGGYGGGGYGGLGGYGGGGHGGYGGYGGGVPGGGYGGYGGGVPGGGYSGGCRGGCGGGGGTFSTSQSSSSAGSWGK